MGLGLRRAFCCVAEETQALRIGIAVLPAVGQGDYVVNSGCVWVWDDSVWGTVLSAPLAYEAVSGEQRGRVDHFNKLVSQPGFTSLSLSSSGSLSGFRLSVPILGRFVLCLPVRRLTPAAVPIALLLSVSLVVSAALSPVLGRHWCGWNLLLTLR